MYSCALIGVSNTWAKFMPLSQFARFLQYHVLMAWTNLSWHKTKWFERKFQISVILNLFRKKIQEFGSTLNFNLMAPFYGWGSTASKLETLWGGIPLSSFLHASAKLLRLFTLNVQPYFWQVSSGFSPRNFFLPFLSTFSWILIHFTPLIFFIYIAWKAVAWNGLIVFVIQKNWQSISTWRVLWEMSKKFPSQTKFSKQT